jgi:hypothetical protein
MLRAASLLVPRPQRAEWLAEWSAELGYVTHAPTRFCLGAFRDGFWLCRNRETPNAPGGLQIESPVRCLLLLAVLAAASVFFARDNFFPLPYREGKLAMISAEGRYDTRNPTMRLERYRTLGGPVAFYRLCPARVGDADLSVAFASANLFELLGVPLAMPAPGSLVLTEAAWRKDFGADPGIPGRAIQVAGRRTVVAGVIPAGAWRLPGRPDAWLLQDREQLDRLPAQTKGFVVGRLWSFTERRWPPFTVSPLDRRPLLLPYLIIMAASLLILATTTRLGLGEYPPHGSLRRWLFLAAKLALVLPIVYAIVSLLSLQLQPQGLFIGSLAGLRWALVDQRRRCPVCLRLLSNPTRIGGPSRTFLEWYGTELICARGHGLLYVPEIRSSCYGVQRWQQLDPSWSSLFL